MSKATKRVIEAADKVRAYAQSTRPDKLPRDLVRLIEGICAGLAALDAETEERKGWKRMTIAAGFVNEADGTNEPWCTSCEDVTSPDANDTDFGRFTLAVPPIVRHEPEEVSDGE